MLGKIKTIWNSKQAKQLTDARNIGLYIFSIIVLAMTWSGVKTVQNNYELQKKISVLKQQNIVLQLQNGNIDLQNKYLQTDEYKDLSARQDLGLAGPGETVLLVPRNVAIKYVDASLVKARPTSSGNPADHRSKYVKNLEDWRDFLLGRRLFDNS